MIKALFLSSLAFAYTLLVCFLLLQELRDLLLKELPEEDVKKYNYKCPHMAEPSSKEIEKSLEDTLLKLVDVRKCYSVFF